MLLSISYCPASQSLQLYYRVCTGIYCRFSFQEKEKFMGMMYFILIANSQLIVLVYPSCV